MRFQQYPHCHGAGCLWGEHNQRQYQMLPPRINCLLLHQFNELFFRDIWLPCLRVGEKVDYQEGRKMLLFSTFYLKYSYCYCLLLWLCILNDWSTLLHALFPTSPCTIISHIPHVYPTLHCRVHLRLFPGFHDLCWVLFSSKKTSLQHTKTLTRVEWLLPPFPALAQRISVSLEVDIYFY